MISRLLSTIHAADPPSLNLYVAAAAAAVAVVVVVVDRQWTVHAFSSGDVGRASLITFMELYTKLAIIYYYFHPLLFVHKEVFALRLTPRLDHQYRVYCLSLIHI